MVLFKEEPPLYFLDDLEFPDPFLDYRDGLIGASGDLYPNRLIKGYAGGYFPWYQDDEGFFHWFMLEERMILFVDDVKSTKKLRQKLRSPKWEIRFNHAFEEVMRHCSGVKRAHEAGTWINEEFVKSYKKLFEKGYAISVETYYEGELVGGFYGVTIGRYFSGESMFHLKNDASKLALIFFSDVCKKNGIEYIDCQVPSQHLGSMGAKVLKKEEYLPLIRESAGYEAIEKKEEQ